MKIPNFDENVYKQVTINGKLVNKWVKLLRIEKYDINENKIYENKNGSEKWMEYDSHNKLIFEKNDDGEEKTWKRKYDSKGNNIYFERVWSGYESWFEYDERNNKIHKKGSDESEWWGEYDSNDNCIHQKKSNGEEAWFEYNENGKLIHTTLGNGIEIWYDRDSNDKCIHQKDSNGDECFFEYDENGHMIHRMTPDGEFWYETECHENGKKKIVLTYVSI